jgi:hypothetical protein
VYPDILELAKHTYDGHDFISVLFHTWLKRPSTSWMCGVRYSSSSVKGNSSSKEAPAEGIIAFMMLDLLDDTSTGWLEALRVHPSHRKQGLARKISEVVKWQAQQTARCKRIRYTTTTKNVASLRIATGLGMHEANRWLFIAEPVPLEGSDFTTSLTGRAAACSETKCLLDSIVPCSDESVAATLQFLLPSAPVLLHDWVARNNTASTVAALLAQGAKFYTSKVDGSMSWCSSRAVFSGDTLHLVGVAAGSAQSVAGHMAFHLALAQTHERESMWVFAPAKVQDQLGVWGLSGISGVRNVAQASPICVMVEAEFLPK